MGRQAHLTRLTLGRSAFEPLDYREHPSHQDNNDVAPPAEDGPIAHRTNHDQQYDKRGYPQNLKSKMLKKQWRHAVNDVLATVGVCVAEGKPEPKAKPNSSDRQKIEEVAFENSLGIFVSSADWGLWWLCMYWPSALRQRLQSFTFPGRMPLADIIKMDLRFWGLSNFLFAGGAASFLFALFDVCADWAKVRALDKLVDALMSRVEFTIPNVRMVRRIHFWSSTVIDIAVYSLILPLELYGTLQRVWFLPSESILPSPGRAFALLTSIARHLYTSPNDPASKLPSLRQVLYLAPLLYPWLALHYQHRVQAKIYQYVWAALPKPTNPDRYSLLGAQERGLDFDTISGLLDERDPRSYRVERTVTDQLAADLQYIGWRFQILYDQAMRTVGVIPLPRWPGGLWRALHTEPAPRDSQAASLPPPLPSPASGLPSPVLQVPAEASLADETQQPPNHFSPPPPSPASSSSDPSPSQPNTPTNPSSTAPSNTSSPRALALYSNQEDGTVHVNLTIAVPTPGSAEAAAAIAAAQQNTAAHRADGPETTPSPHPSRSTSPQPQPQPPPATTPNEEEPQYPYPVPPPEYLIPYSAPPGPHHRVTALTAHPANSIAQRLSSTLTDILFMPLEAWYVRSVISAYLRATTQSPPFQSFEDALLAEAKTGWFKRVIPPTTWFGVGVIGLRTGRSWGGVADYMGKMVLVQGLEAGVGVAVWQVTMVGVWWVGRRWCGWGKL